jgi:hypothetical protein
VPDITITGPNSSSGTPPSQTSQFDAEPKEPSEHALTGSVPTTAHSSSTAEGVTTIPTPPSQPSRPAPQDVQAADEPLINTTMARLLNGGIDLVDNGILTLMGSAEQAPTATSSPGSNAATNPGLGNSVLGAKNAAGPISQPTQAARYSQKNPVRHDDDDDDDDDGVLCPDCTFPMRLVPNGAQCATRLLRKFRLSLRTRNHALDWSSLRTIAMMRMASWCTHARDRARIDSHTTR